MEIGKEMNDQELGNVAGGVFDKVQPGDWVSCISTLIFDTNVDPSVGRVDEIAFKVKSVLSMTATVEVYAMITYYNPKHSETKKIKTVTAKVFHLTNTNAPTWL